LGTEIVTSLEVMNSSRTGTPFWVCSNAALDGGHDVLVLGDALAVAAEGARHGA